MPIGAYLNKGKIVGGSGGISLGRASNISPACCCLAPVLGCEQVSSGASNGCGFPEFQGFQSNPVKWYFNIDAVISVNWTYAGFPGDAIEIGSGDKHLHINPASYPFSGCNVAGDSAACTGSASATLSSAFIPSMDCNYHADCSGDNISSCSANVTESKFFTYPYNDTSVGTPTYTPSSATVEVGHTTVGGTGTGDVTWTLSNEITPAMVKAYAKNNVPAYTGVYSTFGDSQCSASRFSSLEDSSWIHIDTVYSLSRFKPRWTFPAASRDFNIEYDEHLVPSNPSGPSSDTHRILNIHAGETHADGPEVMEPTVNGSITIINIKVTIP